jgi:tRNA A-37 threonylcarbamoyl transferase component Bud32/class 3 adenylate cyclase
MSEAATQVWKGRYEIERPLGRGGMSAVYLAKDRQLLFKRVVVKVLLEEMNEDAWMRQKFFQEMEALARIDHPGVVGVLDSGQTPEGKQFLVMQYIEGQTLRSVIQPGGIDFTRAANLIRQIGNALGAAHEAGVWHRDLKPENIMLQRSGGEDYVKLIDFGIAGIQNSQFTGEKTKIAGSLTYMAPEQFSGSPCAASDTYALGMVAYELLTGEAPFGSNSMTHLVAEDLTMTLPRTRRPDLPETAELALLKALAFQPEARQSSVREFSEELYAALCGAGEMTRRTPEGHARRAAAEPGSLEMAHVLFTDLVGYSLLPMDRQKQYLAEFQGVVRSSPRFRASEKAGDIITLPTGDGMALVFFGDPTAPAQCALEIAAALKSKPHLNLRMGIHTGPVYRVADVNANANVAGGGINVAQRVMDCGDAGHILVSNTVAEVLLQLSDWGPCLCDLGEHSVKHGAKVHLYNLATAEAGNPERPSKIVGIAAPVAPAKKSKAPLVIVGTLLLLVVAAAGAWFAMQPKIESLQVSYQTLAEKGLIAFRVTPPKDGYLYILNYGQDGPKWTFNLLEPRFHASARRSGGRTLRIPEAGGYAPNTAEEKNTPYLVWSPERIPELEELSTAPQAKTGEAIVDDPARIAKLHKFLSSHPSQATSNGSQTEVRTTEKVLVHEISLDRK